MGIQLTQARRPRPIEIVDRIVGAAFWCLPLAVTSCGRTVLDSARGEIMGKGTFEERCAGAPDARTCRLTIDSARYPEALDVRPRDRLTIDDARVFEVIGIAADDGSLVILDLARA
jgi:hypothetical protein